MKILYITQLYPPMLYGGGEYIFAKWAEEMARRGHTVVVLTQQVEGADSFERLNGVDVYRCKPEISYRGALYSIGIYRNAGFLLNAIRLGRKLAKGYDLIHSNTYVPTLAAEVVARLLHIPHLATIHDVYLQTDKEFWEKWSNQAEVGFFSKSAGHFVEKLTIKLPLARVHTVSRTSKEDLVKAGIPLEKVTVVPNGINPEEYQSQATRRVGQAAYVGRLVFYKNLDTVIKAFRPVCDRLPDSRLVIAGKGPCEQSLKDLTMQLGLQDNVIFPGRITDQEKVDLLAESQLMVQPSLIEGFGITVIESLCCGTPVLASNVMPLPELVKDGENGATLPPFDEMAWADTLFDYLQDPEKCRQQGGNGQRLVAEKYTISKVVDRLEDLYRELAAT